MIALGRDISLLDYRVQISDPGVLSYLSPQQLGELCRPLYLSPAVASRS